MILHKIFHLTQSVDEAKQQLANVSAYRHRLSGVERLEFTGYGISHWRLRFPLGLSAKMVVSEIAAESGNTSVFKTLDGNMEVFGIVTFHAIRPTLTEVDVMMNYEFRSPLMRVLDRVFGLGDRFMVKHLRSVRTHFEGVTAPVARVSAPAFAGMALKAA